MESTNIQALKKINMEIYVQKTRTMVTANGKTHEVIKLDGRILEQVENYNYLGAIIE